MQLLIRGLIQKHFLIFKSLPFFSKTKITPILKNKKIFNNINNSFIKIFISTIFAIHEEHNFYY